MDRLPADSDMESIHDSDSEFNAGADHSVLMPPPPTITQPTPTQAKRGHQVSRYVHVLVYLLCIVLV